MRLIIDSTGVKMPTSCHDCFACFGGWCGIMPLEEDERCPLEGRPKWCPLKEQEAVQPTIDLLPVAITKEEVGILEHSIAGLQNITWMKCDGCPSYKKCNSKDTEIEGVLLPCEKMLFEVVRTLKELTKVNVQRDYDK